MATFPDPEDPVTAFSRADGTTVGHANDHGRVIDLAVNAKRYLKGDGTTEDGTAVTDFAAAANAAGSAYIPEGTYVCPDAAPLFASLAADLVIRGAGRNKTLISTKNAYAFQTPATGNIDRVAIRDLSTELRSGSISGGGIKAVSNFYHSGWDISSVDCAGVSTSTDALVHLDGFISSHVDNMRVSGGGGDGIKVASTGFVSNAFSIQRCNVQSCALDATSYAGFRVTGGAHARILNCTTEQHHGYGIYLSGVVWPDVENVWFEDNWNTNLAAEADCIGLSTTKNKFHYHNASAEAASRHIRLTGTGGRHMHTIERNIFQDAPASGVAVEIGANVDQTYLANNRGIGLSGSTGGGTITDGGTNTRYGGNDTDPGFHGGAGSPEGVVIARMGSIYLRTDGGASTSLYVKTSGTGNTGWTAK